MSTRNPRGERWQGALAGVVAGVAGIAVALAATAALRLRVNPIQAVAELIRDITPGPLVEKLIHLVGTKDKPILVIGIVVGLLSLAAFAGLLARRNLMAGQGVFLGMGVLAGIAAATRHGAGPSVAIPVVLGVLTWVFALGFLKPFPLREGPVARLTGEDRRGFLTKVGAVALGAGVAAMCGRYLGMTRRAVEESRRGLRLSVSRGSVPTGADFGIEDLSPWRSPNDNFYRIDTAFVVPAIDPAEWRLRIHGLVDRELSFSYDDLQSRELTEAWITLCCVSNPVGGDLIGNAWWSGVRIADLLAEAGVRPDADAVLQTSKDGWTCGTPLTALTDDRNAMLAIAMNGEPLPLEHGFPVRMVVPGLYGFVSATKWLVDLEVSRFDRFDAYWTPRGWSEQAPIKTQSRIEVPRGGRAMAGDVRVAGTAWAQHTGIERVEVRLDGQAWQEAELARVPGADTWVQWQATVKADPGIHKVAVRATDTTGYTQTAAKTAVAPDGATGWHTVEFTAEG